MARPFQDLRFAIRQVARRPAFAAVAVATLALAIGATTAVFSVLHAVVLAPLELPQLERVVTVWEDHRAREGPETEWTGWSAFSDWRRESTAFVALAAWGGSMVGLAGPEGAEGVDAGAVSAGYFQVLGVQPVLGREFVAAEEVTSDEDLVAILSHGLWQRAFAADPEILGKSVEVNGRQRAVVGVLPAGYTDPLRPGAEIWLPLSFAPERQDYGNYFLRVVGRLHDGFGLQAAEAELTQITRGIAERHPTVYRDITAHLLPLQDFVVGETRAPVYALFGAVLLVLAIACVNLANLLLARAGERTRELAVRQAVGAGQGRLVRQLLTEALVLAVAGGVAGVALAAALMRALVAMAPADTPRLAEVALDPTVLAFAVGVTLVAGLAFGLLPAWLTARGSLAQLLRHGDRRTAAGGNPRLRGALVVGQLALALSLLVGAGLLVRTLWELQQVDPGFVSDQVLAAYLVFPSARFPEGSDVVAQVRQLEEELGRDPRVTATGTISVLPLSGNFSDISYGVEGHLPLPGEERATQYRGVTPGVFSALGLPLRAGRLIHDGDDAAATQVAVVDESFARMMQRTLGIEDPIGQRLRLGAVQSDERPAWTIVGVVGGVRHTGLAAPLDPIVYLPLTQSLNRGLQIVVRTGGNPEQLVPYVREALRRADPALPVMGVLTGTELLGRQTATPRFLATLLAAFAMVAIVLSALGIYGVMALLVGQRQREIGVRLALGARPREVLALVLRHGAMLALLGVALGLAGAAALSRALESLLFGVAAHDPWTLAGVSALLLVAAMAATLVPALRASRVDPLTSLREE